MSKFLKNMPYDRALEKAMRYCSYQERCVLDLEKRFYAWNVKKSDWDKIIDNLIKEDFLNEIRYIEGFVRGKFRMKKWGKNKIKMGLMNKQVFDEKSFITVFDSEIIEEDYLQTMKYLIQQKLLLIENEEALKKRDKLYRYLLSKGYESELIISELNNIDIN